MAQAPSEPHHDGGDAAVAQVLYATVFIPVRRSVGQLLAAALACPRTSYSVVADYSLLVRLYGLLGSVIVMSTSSFFPAFREAYERGDRNWVRKNFFL